MLSLTAGAGTGRNGAFSTARVVRDARKASACGLADIVTNYLDDAAHHVLRAGQLR
jgi:hypothetical protein